MWPPACAVLRVDSRELLALALVLHPLLQLQGTIQAGPRGANLEPFLAALQRLEAAIDFLQAHRSMQSAEDALRHTTALRDSGLAACAAECGALLRKHAAIPEALLARLRAAAEASSGGRAAGSSSVAAADAAAPVPLDLLPEATLARLRSLAAAMLGSGGSSSEGGRSCVRIYVEARSGVLRSALSSLLAPLSSMVASASSSKDGAAQLTWQHVETRIPGCADGGRAVLGLDSLHGTHDAAMLMLVGSVITATYALAHPSAAGWRHCACLCGWPRRRRACAPPSSPHRSRQLCCHRCYKQSCMLACILLLGMQALVAVGALSSARWPNNQAATNRSLYGCPVLQVAIGGAAPLLEAADAVLAVRRVPEKLFGCLDMHDAVEAALGPLQAALAVGGSRLEHRSMGMDRAALVGQLVQARVGRGAGQGVCRAGEGYAV